MDAGRAPSAKPAAPEGGPSLSARATRWRAGGATPWRLGACCYRQPGTASLSRATPPRRCARSPTVVIGWHDPVG